MTAHSTNQLDTVSTSKEAKGERQMQVTVLSFGYKKGAPPLANCVFDVRFLKNPFWVEHLRPLTGLDEPVQSYVLEQPVAQEFLDSLETVLAKILPKFAEMKVENYVIALGCTGGQHRSATLAEALSCRLKTRFPQYAINPSHRELDKAAEEKAGEQR
ncbi:MAG TPA: RNase adapter RapZ [Planktothrix sp.]|jgi:UPF0042 nucleotide-binding protein